MYDDDDDNNNNNNNKKKKKKVTGLREYKYMRHEFSSEHLL
jgi:hypothetical protein